MAFGSQATKVEAMSTLTGLTHDIFVGRVVNNVRRESKTAMLFQDAQPGEYRLEGQHMVFAADLRFKTGALATSGQIPDYVPMDAIQGRITPIRRYQRIAVDNLIEKQASGPGAFDDLTDRIFDLLWNAWSSMEIRHSIGDSSGVLCKVSSRTSSTVFVVTAGYGNAGTNPVQHISIGSILAWYDVSVPGIAGAGTVSAINETTNTITVTTSGTWEPGNVLAVDDLIFFATTPSITTDYFLSERNLAPNGLGTIVDPAAGSSTVFNIVEATYPRWKPYRKASVTFDHMELTEHWLQLAAKRGFDVTPQTDVVVSHPAPVAQVARSLMGYQQQAYTGNALEGGYQLVRVAGIDIVQDHFFYHNVAMTLNKAALFRIPLGGDADFWAEDGSMWARIADFDGKEAWVVDYLNFFSNHRGAHGALTGITTDLTSSDFDPVPNY